MYNNFIEYLKARPLAEARDAIKFAYQSVMGPGHMAPERVEAEERLRRELAEGGQRPEGQPERTLLEGGAARVDVDCSLSPESLAALFCLTAEEWPESRAADVLNMISSPDLAPYLPVGTEEALNKWQAEGCPAVSHSDNYKKAYRAHYRVVSKRFLPFFEAIAALEKLERPAVVAIDGMCGSGKSTLAGVLGYIFGAPVVHMDDFFLPFEMKTIARIAEPGGNVHYERFDGEVAAKIKRGEAFDYGVYDCSQGKIASVKRLEPSPLVIVEGSYCLNPHIRDIYDLKIFVETDPQTQLDRLSAREGDNIKGFIDRWIPLENRYFSKLDIKNKCHVVVRT